MDMQLLEFTQQLTQKQYQNLTIILNPENDTEIISKLEKSIPNLKIIDMGKFLAKKILDGASPTDIEKILADFMDNEKSEFFLITNSGILFDASLTLDPLRLFKKLSVTRKLIVLWYGKRNNNQLTYAQRDHSEYNEYIIPKIDARIIDLEDA